HWIQERSSIPWFGEDLMGGVLIWIIILTHFQKINYILSSLFLEHYYMSLGNGYLVELLGGLG
ncbi:hypothetical protein ACJX0J_039119, partial [Zea mays]